MKSKSNKLREDKLKENHLTIEDNLPWSNLPNTIFVSLMAMVLIFWIQTIEMYFEAARTPMEQRTEIAVT